jgi:hypothetical protein
VARASSPDAGVYTFVQAADNAERRCVTKDRIKKRINPNGVAFFLFDSVRENATVFK